jgi:multidrug efflux pump subunit AcrA (membrane-fusion protein)
MSRLSSWWSTIKTFAIAHKVWSAVIVVVVILGGWWIYGKVHGSSTPTTYALTTVQNGTIVQTVSGSGQVTPSNEITINPQASGQITEVLVKDGAQVGAGQALAYIDSTDEYNSVQSAKASLQSAQLSLEKLQEPPTDLQTTQDQDSISKAQQSEQNDQTNLTNEYASAYSDIVATFLDLPTIQTQLQDIVTGTEASHGAQWNIDFYQSATENWDSIDAISLRTNTFNDYQAALASYTQTYADFQKTTSTASTSTIAAALTETYSAVQAEQTALNTANSDIEFYQNQTTNHSETPVSESTTALSTLSSDITKIDSHLTSLQNDNDQITSDQQAIINDANSITEDQETY